MLDQPPNFRPTAASMKTAPAAREPRAPQRRRMRRGMILIFVILILSLLAIMGIAYLVTTRTDRNPIIHRGALPGRVEPRLADGARLDQLFAGASRRLQQVVIEDLFNLQPGLLLSRQDPAKLSATQKLEIAAAFRQEATPQRSAAFTGAASTPFYENYDAPGRADPWLSSLLPVNRKATAAEPDLISWPWISAPLTGEPRSARTGSPTERGDPAFGADLAREILPGIDVEPFFSDPRALSESGFDPAQVWASQDLANPADAATPRQNARIGSVTMKRSAASSPQSKVTRIYPGLTLFPDDARRRLFMAADADGDGIADSGMMPVVLNPRQPANTAARYVDTANGVIYFVGYRIIDNSAQINLNTALSVQGDFETAGTLFSSKLALREALAGGRPDGPNLGFFRSNVGLLELLREMLRPYPAAISPTPREISSFCEARFPFLASSSPFDPAFVSSIAPSAPGASALDYCFRSLGDMLEQQVARRPEAPGSLCAGQGTVLGGGLQWLPIDDAISLAARSGTLLDPRLTPGAGEMALSLSLRMAAPNFTTGGEPAWRWFPPNEVSLWYHWTKSFDLDPPSNGALPPGAIGMLDANPNPAAPTYSFRIFDFPGGSGLVPAKLPKSIRSLLTGYSGVTSQAPMRRDPDCGNPAGVPWGMPGYGTDLDAGQYPNAKVSAATGTKEQLWRAYWSAMTENQGAGWAVNRKHPANGDGPGLTYDAFLPPDRHPSALPVTPHPANTPLERLTEKQMALIRSAIAACNTIDLRDSDQDITALTIDLNNVNPDDPASDRLFARVYGTERQLAITAVVIDQPQTGRGLSREIYVELFNPSDEPIDLRAYRLGVVSRGGGPNVTLATGTITPTAELTQMVELASPGQEMLQPGGFLVLWTADGPPNPGRHRRGIETAGANPGGASQVLYRWNQPQRPTRLLRDCVRPCSVAMRDRELVLMRTQRADGAPSAENAAALSSLPHAWPALGEGPLDASDSLLSLVPIDAVDLRSLSYPNVAANLTGQRYIYIRQTNHCIPRQSAPDPAAWKVFYAGSSYDRAPLIVDPANPGGAKIPGPPNPLMPPLDSGRPRGWAWREYPVNNPAARDAHERLGAVLLGAPRDALAPSDAPPAPAPATAHPFFAPTIPIQNFKPWSNDPLAKVPGELDPTPKQFPFGSPFARNGDLLAVPFIGSYKIYRVPANFTAADAPVLYEYVPLPMDAWAVCPRADEITLANPSIGRFDPRTELIPGLALTGDETFTNEWAGDLLDFVTARQAPYMTIPDVPAAQSHVIAPGAGAGAGAGAGGSLICGIINVNTAPPINRRMLPWAVLPDRGQVDTAVGSTSAAVIAQRERAAIIEHYVESLADRKTGQPPFGISSTLSLAQILSADPSPPEDPDTMQRMGDLQPFNRPDAAHDFVSIHRDMTRLSNLVSQRSDVFTVYVTVQAWSWMGDAQASDTRLVGERRGSFIVDRSRISEMNYRPADLIIVPVEQE